jgi:hypothetical protein
MTPQKHLPAFFLHRLITEAPPKRCRNSKPFGLLHCCSDLELILPSPSSVSTDDLSSLGVRLKVLVRCETCSVLIIYTANFLFKTQKTLHRSFVEPMSQPRPPSQKTAYFIKDRGRCKSRIVFLSRSRSRISINGLASLMYTEAESLDHENIEVSTFRTQSIPYFW